MTPARPPAPRVTLPPDIDEFRRSGAAFAAELRECKRRVSIPDYGWYPYETMAALPVIADLLSPVYSEIAESLAGGTVTDVGCGDGDLAAWFARMGCVVDAIDHAESNFNQLRGAAALARELSLPVNIHDVDLDRPFALARPDYALALFLGTLYHLKNPFYALEALAARADWCLLSTRVAQVTAGGQTRIEDEPVAYLLGAREANNDPTNFWIFSPAGLRRLLERAGWVVVGNIRQGCSTDSNPVDAAADERAFVLARSRTRHPGLYVRPLDGWHAAENDAFRWTAKRFALEVTAPEGSREFALRFWTPEAVLASGPVRITCATGGQPAGAITCDSSAPLEFRGWLPGGCAPARLDFTVESRFQAAGDERDLGVCVPLLDATQRHTQRIPFRVS